MSRQLELTRALEHLEAARRHCRAALALRVLPTVNRAIRLAELERAAGRPAQSRLALEPGEPSPVGGLR